MRFSPDDMPIAGIKLLPKTIHNSMNEFDYGEFPCPDELLSDFGEWKPIECWNVDDILRWLMSEARGLKICYTELCGEKFALFNGVELLQMNLKQFLQISLDYGHHLYNSIQRISKARSHVYHLNTAESPQDSKSNVEEKRTYINLDETGPSDESSSVKNDVLKPNLSHSTRASDESNIDIKSEPSAPTPSNELGIGIKRSRGRPKNPNKKGKKKTEKLGRLWEFLRELLKDPNHCPSKIKWENHDEGMFRFVKSDQVAKIWGKRKENLQMSYEKLSRAMRYYYKSKVLLPVYGRRLVYKFGPNAKDWKVDDPNFEKARNQYPSSE